VHNIRIRNMPYARLWPQCVKKFCYTVIFVNVTTTINGQRQSELTIIEYLLQFLHLFDNYCHLCANASKYFTQHSLPPLSTIRCTSASPTLYFQSQFCKCNNPQNRPAFSSALYLVMLLCNVHISLTILHTSASVVRNRNICNIKRFVTKPN